MSKGRTAKWQDGRVVAWTHHALGGQGQGEPDDNWRLPHGMTWGEFKELRKPRPLGHGRDGQHYPTSKSQKKRKH